MNEKVVRLGVVGLGRGFSVAKDVLGEAGVKLVAICDRDSQKIEGALKYLAERGVADVKCYSDFDQMVPDTDIDAVFIATDAICHVPYAIRALDAGKHVLSEIPAVNSVEEARALKAAVKRHPELKYMTGENCCYWAFIQMWKQMYDEGRLGEAIYAESEYIHSRDWREMKPEDYPKEHWRYFNPAIKYLTHNLGPLLYIMDDHCVSVSCMTPDVKYNPYREVQKNGVALFKTAKGAVIRILITFDTFAGFDHNFRIMGTRGSVETDPTKELDEAHSFARFSDIPGSIQKKVELPVTLKFEGEEDSGHGGADKKMMMAFIHCIINDTKPPIDVDFGIRISLPGIIAHESSVLGGTALEIPVID
ncbi:MAG: Gfo/Idh/MocA family oxidoreductase [Ruminococcaceae bacterium]|nr:Gfo/Idh/MocA family oxidoreductase [Oscillospiraceae bacterium]